MTTLQRHLAIGLLIIAGFAALPLVVTERYLLGEIIVFFIWAMVAMNWNVLMGHAGVFSLAQMLFVVCGAYGVAMGATFAGLSIWAAIPIAALISAVLALVIGMACLRLTGAYVSSLWSSCQRVCHIWARCWSIGSRAGPARKSRPGNEARSRIAWRPVQGYKLHTVLA